MNRTFTVQVTETTGGQAKEAYVGVVTSLQEGEDVGQEALDVFAQAYQPGLEIIPRAAGAQAFDSPSRLTDKPSGYAGINFGP